MLPCLTPAIGLLLQVASAAAGAAGSAAGAGGRPAAAALANGIVAWGSLFATADVTGNVAGCGMASARRAGKRCEGAVCALKL